MNNFVLAKIRGENDYKKLMNDQILYDDVETAIFNCEELDLSNTIDDTVLEEDKWHFINNFSSTEYSMSILTKIGDSVDYAQYSSTDSNDIVHIIVCQENYLCLQGISKSKVIKRKFITINETVRLEKNSDVLFVREFPDAIYSCRDDRLYFKTLRSISSLFKNISNLYREATNEEVETFLQNGFIRLEGNYNKDSVGIPNRRRIVLVSEILNDMPEEKRSNVFAYINGYVPTLNYSEGAFTISSDEDLKNLLYGIDERFYTTPIGQERRIARSIKKLPRQE